MEIEKLEEALLSISYADENTENAESAFNTLYREYSKFLFAVVRKNLSNIGINDNHLTETVVNNTFIKIYYNPLKYTLPTDELDKTDRSFKAWISKIAKNELHDLFKEFKVFEVISAENISERAFNEIYIDTKNINTESLNTKILEDALNLLSERDRDILRALYLFHEEGKNSPSEVLNELCNFFGTTKDNIRKIKERSEDKIIKHFSKHSQLIPLKYAK